LLYMGDELGLRNDYSYVKDPAKKDDSRWVNRVAVNEQQLESATDRTKLSGKVYQQLQQLLGVRRRLPLLGQGKTEILASANPHLFSYRRYQDQQSLLCVVNFSEHSQTLAMPASSQWRDELSGNLYQGARLELQPYQVLWLTAL